MAVHLGVTRVKEDSSQGPASQLEGRRVVGKDLRTDKGHRHRLLRTKVTHSAEFSFREMETGLGTLKVNPAPLILPGHGRGLHPSRRGRKSTVLFPRRRGLNVFCGPEDFMLREANY